MTERHPAEGDDEDMRSPTDRGSSSDTVPSTDSVAPSGGGAAASRKVRSGIAIVLGVLAIIALIVATVAVWARAVVFDSEQVADLVGDALAEPEVEAALAGYVTEQVLSAVDVDAAVSDALPADLDRLEPAIVAGVESAVDRGVTRALDSPEVQEIITQVVERAHSRAMDLLQGDGLSGAISAVDGEVTVNLLPLIGRGLTRLQELGLFDDLGIPDLSADGDPTEQIAELEDATGRDLPDDFGQLVVYQSDDLADRQASLESAQQTVALAKRAVWALVMLTTALLVATVIVARNRWRAALWLGLGGIVAMVITRSLTHRVVDEAPEIAATSGGRAAISAIVDGAADEPAPSRCGGPHRRRRGCCARDVPPAMAARGSCAGRRRADVRRHRRRARRQHHLVAARRRRRPPGAGGRRTPGMNRRVGTPPDGDGASGIQRRPRLNSGRRLESGGL